MARADLDPSRTAEAFGATLDVEMRDRGLYLVKSRHRSPAAQVRLAGGEVAVRLSVRNLLAVLPVTSYFALRNHPDIAFTGPVSIDPQRFARFANLFGVNPERRPAAKKAPPLVETSPGTREGGTP